MAIALNTSPQEMIGKRNHDFLPKDSAYHISKEEQYVMDTGEPAELPVRLQQPDVEHAYITSKFPLFDDGGTIYAIGSTSVDITLLNRAHEALEKSYQQQQSMLNGLQQALSASSDLLYIINEQGKIVMVSDTATQIFGYTPKELMRKRYMDFLVEEDKAKQRWWQRKSWQAKLSRSSPTDTNERTAPLFPSSGQERGLRQIN